MFKVGSSSLTKSMVLQMRPCSLVFITKFCQSWDLNCSFCPMNWNSYPTFNLWVSSTLFQNEPLDQMKSLGLYQTSLIWVSFLPLISLFQVSSFFIGYKDLVRVVSISLLIPFPPFTISLWVVFTLIPIFPSSLFQLTFIFPPSHVSTFPITLSTF